MRRFLLALVVLLAASACGHSASPAGSQRIVYLVVDTAGSSPLTTTAVTDVASPYRGRTVTHQGSSIHGPLGGGFVWDERGVYTIKPDGSTTQNEYIAPGFPGPFSRLDLALPVALRQHLVASLGPGMVGKRSCTRWVSQLPLDGAPLSPATGGDRTESCVDPAGQLLSETWQVGGKVVRTRTAQSLGPGPSLVGKALFLGRQPTSLPTQRSAFVVHRSSAKELTTLMQVPAPKGPPGLTADQAVAVLDVDSSRQGFAREAAVLTWVGPSQLAVLRIERDLEQVGAVAPRGAPVDVGTLGSGRLEPVLAGLRVTVDGPRGLRLIATADLPESILLAWLRSLSL